MTAAFLAGMFVGLGCVLMGVWEDISMQREVRQRNC